ncbi:MAG TPA: patatin-like phospholipase family protein [Gaiellaceae bacterium]|nr:patatin-like phospholipase family protein [Gaiellaceae bacterium]
MAGSEGHRRDVGVVLSGGGVNGVMMELGFLQRLRESPLWPRVAVVFGTSSGALSGAMAVLDRLDELEPFLLHLQPEQTFRPNRLWQLPFLGLHDYVLPRTIESAFGDVEEIARDLTAAPIELVVLATDVTDDDATAADGFELVYSSRRTDPRTLAQAILASAAVSALVLPLRVGDRIATDGSWVRNFPLGHAAEHPEVELVVAFRYLPHYPRLGVLALERMRRRLERFRRLPPIRAFLEELDRAEERAARGEPAHLADMIVRLARVSILRNTQLEEGRVYDHEQADRELRRLRDDVLQLLEAHPPLQAAVGERFADARFPFRHDGVVPRVVVRGSNEGAGLDPGFRNQPHWAEDEKRALIRAGWLAADAELRSIDAAPAAPTLVDLGT